MIIENGLEKAEQALKEITGAVLCACETKFHGDHYTIKCLNVSGELSETETAGYLVSIEGKMDSRWAVCEHVLEVGQAFHALKGGQ